MQLTLILGLATCGYAKLLSVQEFVTLADSFAKHALGTFNVTRATCDAALQPTEGGATECYVALVGSGRLPKDATRQAPLQPASPLEAVYYAENSFDRASKALDAGVDVVQLAMGAHPECSVIRYDLEKLADTHVGSGSVGISDSDSERVTHGWKVGTSVTYKTPFKAIAGGASLTLSADYSGSIATTSSSSVGLRFDVPADATCTPHLLRFSVMCNAVSFRAQYFRNGTQVANRLTRVAASAKPFLMPTNQLTPDFFKVITGCIDLSL